MLPEGPGGGHACPTASAAQLAAVLIQPQLHELSAQPSELSSQPPLLSSQPTMLSADHRLT